MAAAAASAGSGGGDGIGEEDKNTQMLVFDLSTTSLLSTTTFSNLAWQLHNKTPINSFRNYISPSQITHDKLLESKQTWPSYLALVNMTTTTKMTTTTTSTTISTTTTISSSSSSYSPSLSTMMMNNYLKSGGELINDFSSHINLNAWPVLFLSVFIVLGFVGNLLVCLAIKLDSRLQNATNYYLFSLATTDLLVSVIVIPLAIVNSLLS